MSDTPVRVVVADDHPLFREGVRALVADTPSTELVGLAANGDEAVDVALAERPDVVVMDLRMPGLGGVEATRRIVRAAPSTAVLVLTMIDEDASVFAALRAGARGYVLKGAEPAEILRSILAVAQGQAIFGPAVAARLAEFFAPTGSAAAPAAFPALTAREREILELMATGAPNAAIAHRLGVSDKTVRNNVSAVFAKLHVTDRAAAVARARDAGLGVPARPPRDGS